MVAIFTYGFALAEENFKKADVKLITLSNYQELLKIAIDTGYINSDQLRVLQEWRNDPANWMQKK